MKTFRLIGMALLAVVMCLNFTSCNDDDEEPVKNDDGIVANQKRLVRINEGEYANDFIYDSEGRLSTIFYDDYTYNNNSTYNYTWGDGTITEIWKYNNGRDEKTTTFSINRNNNLIRSSRQGSSSNTYTYNSSNQLIELKMTWFSITNTFTWEKDKITKVIERDGNNDVTTFEYIYSGKSCKGYLPVYDIFIKEGVLGNLIYAHPELMGLRCTQLPDQKISRSGNYESTEKYTYTFDKDGYLESCTITDEYDQQNYTFTWE